MRTEGSEGDAHPLLLIVTLEKKRKSVSTYAFSSRLLFRIFLASEPREGHTGTLCSHKSDGSRHAGHASAQSVELNSVLSTNDECAGPVSSSATKPQPLPLREHHLLLTAPSQSPPSSLVKWSTPGLLTCPATISAASYHPRLPSLRKVPRSGP